MKKNYNKKIGQVIKSLRKKAKLSQTEFADAAGIGQSQVSKAERGDVGFTIPVFIRITKALSVSLGEFFTKVDKA